MFSSMPLTQNSTPGPSERPGGLLIEAGSPFRFLASRALSGHKLWGPRLSEGETKLEDSRARLGGPLGQAPVSAKPNYDVSWLHLTPHSWLPYQSGLSSASSSLS